MAAGKFASTPSLVRVFRNGYTQMIDILFSVLFVLWFFLGRQSVVVVEHPGW